MASPGGTYPEFYLTEEILNLWPKDAVGRQTIYKFQTPSRLFC